MLKAAYGCEETLIHVCPEGKGKPPVYLHDVFSYMHVDGKQVWFKFCPYCSMEIEKDSLEKNDKKVENRMTRRRIVFTEANGVRWITPEFNGDKTEFEQFKMGDVCVATWDQILQLFSGDETKEDFEQSNNNAQYCYESRVAGREKPLPIEAFASEEDFPTVDHIHYLSGNYANIHYHWDESKSKPDSHEYILKLVFQCSSPADAKRILTRIKYEMHSLEYDISMSDVSNYTVDMQAEFIFCIKNHTEDIEEKKIRIETKLDSIISSPDFYRDSEISFMQAILDQAEEKGYSEKYFDFVTYYPKVYTDKMFVDLDSVFATHVTYDQNGIQLVCCLIDGTCPDDWTFMGEFITDDNGLESAKILGEFGGVLTYLANQYMKQNILKFDLND